MSRFLRTFLIGLFVVTMTVACSQKAEETDTTMESMSEAVEPVSDAMSEAAEATADVVEEAKADAIDAVEAAKEAASEQAQGFFVVQPA